MKAKLICYSLKNLNAVEKVAFRRHVYGFKDHSNNNKYSYKRTGIMESVSYRKILDCVIIVNDPDAQKVVKAMKSCKATVHVFPVLISFKI